LQRRERDDGGGKRVRGEHGEQGGGARGRFLGEQRVGRGDDDQPGAASQRLAGAGGVAPFAAQHDHQVERADPAGQVPDRPGHEGHRAGRFEDGAEQPGLGADGDDRAGAALPGEAVDRLV
jgi:hypothetical protein